MIFQRSSAWVQVVTWLHQQAGAWDSVHLAAHLERLGRKGGLAEEWQLALDMYARLGMHDRHCQMLLAKASRPEQAACCPVYTQAVSCDCPAVILQSDKDGHVLVYNKMHVHTNLKQNHESKISP